MTTPLNRLTKHFGYLEPRQRLALIEAAAVRGDDHRWRQLMDSAPRQEWILPDHHGSSLGRCDAGRLHVISMLELLVKLWQAETYFCESMNDTEAEILNQICTLNAYELAVHHAAWIQFCQDIGSDPVASIECLSSLLVHTDLPPSEHTADTIKAACPKLFEHPDQPVLTVEAVLQGYHYLLAKREEEWTQKPNHQ